MGEPARKLQTPSPDVLASSLAVFLTGGLVRPATTERAQRAAHLLARMQAGAASRPAERAS